MIAIAILEIWHTPIFSQLVRFDFPWPKREHRLLTEALSQTLREYLHQAGCLTFQPLVHLNNLPKLWCWSFCTSLDNRRYSSIFILGTFTTFLEDHTWISWARVEPERDPSCFQDHLQTNSSLIPWSLGRISLVYVESNPITKDINQRQPCTISNISSLEPYIQIQGTPLLQASCRSFSSFDSASHSGNKE